MQMLIEMISTAEEIVVTTTMITVRDELLSFPAQSGKLLNVGTEEEKNNKTVRKKKKIKYRYNITLSKNSLLNKKYP